MAALDARQAFDQLAVPRPQERAHRLLHEPVRPAQHEVDAGRERHRAGAVVRRHLYAEAVRELGDRQRLAEPARPLHVRGDDADHAALQQREEAAPARDGLAGGDAHAYRVLQACEVVHGVGPDRVFDPEGLERRHRAADGLGRAEAPQAVKLDHQVHRRGRFADRRDDRQPARGRRSGHRLRPSSPLPGRTARPSSPGCLRPGARARARPGGSRTPRGLRTAIAGRSPSWRSPDASSSRRSPSPRKCCKCGSGRERVRPAGPPRAAHAASRKVPERDVDRAAAARLDAAALVAHVGRERRGRTLGRGIGESQQYGGDVVVQIRLAGAGREEGLAETDAASSSVSRSRTTFGWNAGRSVSRLTSVTASLSPGWRFEQNRRMEDGLRVPLVAHPGVHLSRAGSRRTQVAIRGTRVAKTGGFSRDPKANITHDEPVTLNALGRIRTARNH